MHSFIYALQSAFDDVVILIVGCCRTYTHYKKVHYFKVSVSAFPAFMHSVQQLCPFEVPLPSVGLAECRHLLMLTGEH